MAAVAAAKDGKDAVSLKDLETAKDRHMSKLAPFRVCVYVCVCVGTWQRRGLFEGFRDCKG